MVELDDNEQGPDDMEMLHPGTPPWKGAACYTVFRRYILSEYGLRDMIGWKME